VKQILNIENWPRKEHFHFFRKFDEPFFGVTVTVDCTAGYAISKTEKIPFFLYYLYKTLVAINQIEPFRYRISGEEVFIYDRIDASPTISRQDGSFGFSLIEYNPDFQIFYPNALAEIERIKNTPGLFTREFSDNLIHFSALPWVNFTALSHARNSAFPDSCPKISFGKMTITSDGKRTMPMSVHVHHGLMDGLHVGQFIDFFQTEMNRNSL